MCKLVWCKQAAFSQISAEGWISAPRGWISTLPFFARFRWAETSVSKRLNVEIQPTKGWISVDKFSIVKGHLPATCGASRDMAIPGTLISPNSVGGQFNAIHTDTSLYTIEANFLPMHELRSLQARAAPPQTLLGSFLYTKTSFCYHSGETLTRVAKRTVILVILALMRDANDKNARRITCITFSSCACFWSLLTVKHFHSRRTS